MPIRSPERLQPALIDLHSIPTHFSLLGADEESAFHRPPIERGSLFRSSFRRNALIICGTYRRSLVLPVPTNTTDSSSMRPALTRGWESVRPSQGQIAENPHRLDVAEVLKNLARQIQMSGSD